MKFLITVCLVYPLMAFSQKDTLPRNNETGKYEYSEVVNVDSASAGKLYSNAKLFIVDAFKSGKDVTQLNDENTKTVGGTGSIHIQFKGIGLAAVDKYLRFKISIQCKDGRYKYTINNFEFIMIDSRTTTLALEDETTIKKHYLTKSQYSQFIQQTTANLNELVMTIKKYMSSQAGATKDW